MDNSEQEGDNLIQEIHTLLSNPIIDYNLIIQNLQTAYKKFKSCESYFKAGDALCLMADIYQTHVSQGNHKAACTYEIAGKMFMNVDKIKTKEVLILSSELFLKDNNFYKAGNVNQTLASIYVDEGSIDYIDYLQNAYDYYSKAAYLLIDSDQYKEASKYLKLIYRNFSLFEKSYKFYNTEILLLDIGIIELYLKDITECKNWLESCSQHKETDEFKILSSLLDAYEKHDVGKFNEIIDECQLITSLNIHISKLIRSILDDMKK
jgi:hypothetical protein